MGIKEKRKTSGRQHLQLARSVEVLKGLLNTLAHGLLTLANPDAGVEELLVGLVGTVGVTDLGHEVVLVLENEVTDTGQVGVLHVGVDVDLDDTVADGLLELGLGGAGATVEDEEDGLARLGLGLLGDVLLVLGEELGVELDVAGLVDTVDVTEAGGNGEVGADGAEGVVDGQDVLGLGVEGVVVNILVVDTILLTTGDTDLLQLLLALDQSKASCIKLTYHLEPLLHGGSTLQVGGGSGDVPVDGLLRQVDHVGGEEGLAVELEVALVLIEHAIEPRQELLGAVVGVEDDRDTVSGGDAADVVGSGDGASNGGLLVSVAHTLTGEVGSTTLGDLQNDGAVLITGSFERSDNGGGGGDVLRWLVTPHWDLLTVRTHDGGDSELLLLGVLEETENIVADNNAGLAVKLFKDTHDEVCTKIRK
jgi:hypothetical protein